jgi:hypothetical protein
MKRFGRCINWNVLVRMGVVATGLIIIALKLQVRRYLS